MESKIRYYLLEKQAINNWSQDAMAAKLDVPKGTLNRWIHGRSIPDLDSMYKIADGLGVPFEEVANVVKGDYTPLTESEREGVLISKKYSSDAIFEAVKIHPEREKIYLALKALYEIPKESAEIMIQEQKKKRGIPQS